MDILRLWFRKIRNFFIVFFGINNIYIRESLEKMTADVNNVSFDEAFEKVNSLSGKWDIDSNKNKFFFKYSIEKDKTEYNFLDSGESFKKCLENIVFRVFDFEVNKKDTFSNFR